jgi:hypothetical protein
VATPIPKKSFTAFSLMAVTRRKEAMKKMMK